MNINKTAIKAILIILVCGVCITWGVQAYMVSDTAQSQIADSSETDVTPAQVIGTAAPMEQSTEAVVVEDTSEVAQESSSMDNETLSYSVLKDRLAETEKSLDTTRQSSTDNTTQGQRNLAAAELKSWETQLTFIYNTILDRIGPDEAELLAKSEQDWLKDRDVQAAEQAISQTGGSKESLEYIQAQATATKDRAYALLEEYKLYLGD